MKKQDIRICIYVYMYIMLRAFAFLVACCYVIGSLICVLLTSLNYVNNVCSIKALDE